MRRIITLAALTALGAAAPLVAQGRGRGNGGIPPGHRPPAGMCRVWIDGVPPGRQPAATDCSTAVRSVPRNGRVIWGDQTTSSRVYDPRVNYPGGVYDPRHDSRVYNPGGVYDPRHDSRVNSAGGVYDPRHDSRVDDRRIDRHRADKRAKHARKGDGDHDRDDRYDRDKFTRR
jgi:hypothetical protein